MRTRSIGQALRSSVEELERAGMSRPLFEAEMILCHVLGLGRAALYMDSDGVMGTREVQNLERILRERAEGRPLQYLTGGVGFYTCDLAVDPRALIPRPDTETLVDVVLDLAKQVAGFSRIADVGTGSGNIAISLARHLPRSEIMATDISWEAATLARENAALNGVGTRVRFIVADLLGPLAGGIFDLVVANPPYVPDEEWRSLPSEVRDHEPEVALRGGEGGLEVIGELVRAARRVLRDGGAIALEFGDGQGAPVRSLFESCGYGDFTMHKDINGKPRVAVAFKKKKVAAAGRVNTKSVD